MPLRINQNIYTTRSGGLFLETELVSRYKKIEQDARDVVDDAAEAAAKSMRRDLAKNSQSGRLLESVNVEKSNVTSRRHKASVSVGENVSYSKWFFEGTGLYGPKNSMIYPVSAKKMGPIAPNTYRSGKGPKFLGSSKGQKPNNEIIESAFRKSEAVVARKINRLT